jgi:hypothetical protein
LNSKVGLGVSVVRLICQQCPQPSGDLKVWVKIFFLKQKRDLPKLLSPIDTKEDALLETLRARLEQLNVFKRLGPFHFRDAKEGCRIDVDFEALNSIRDCVYLIPAEDDVVSVLGWVTSY